MSTVTGWLVQCRIPAEDLGQLRVPERLSFKGGQLRTHRQGDQYRSVWTDAHGQPKVVATMAEAYALSFQAGRHVAHQVQVAQPRYAAGMATA